MRNFSTISIALLVAAIEVFLGFRGLSSWLRQISRKSCLESRRLFLKRRSAAALGDRWGPAIATFDLVLPVHSVQDTQPSHC